jgi:hypothetical protein
VDDMAERGVGSEDGRGEHDGKKECGEEFHGGWRPHSVPPGARIGKGIPLRGFPKMPDPKFVRRMRAGLGIEDWKTKGAHRGS